MLRGAFFSLRHSARRAMPPVTYTLSDRAYVKLVLHALKHPTRAVCGVLVGRASGDAGVEVGTRSDAAQLACGDLCAEIALEQRRARRARGRRPATRGYYHANELARDGSFAARRRRSRFHGACAMPIDPRARARGGRGAPPETSRARPARGPARGARARAPRRDRGAGRGERKLARCHADGRGAMLVDFDDHLDDPADDWKTGLDPVIAAAADDGA